nr:hypothetical protein [uncultured bacterium]
MDTILLSHRCRTALLIAALIFATVGCRTPSTRSGEIGSVDVDAPTEFTQTDSGLRYRILRRGDGKRPTATSDVTVDYVGWLDDGSEFDSSYAGRKPTSFNLSAVVPGWTEGIPLVSQGGMIELEVPAKLGYGNRGIPGTIPPGATLHFKVELHDIQ